MSNGGMRLLPATQLSSLGVVPTLWPVVGKSPGILESGLIRSVEKAHSTLEWILRHTTATKFARRQTES